jgi:hypothetical protein
MRRPSSSFLRGALLFAAGALASGAIALAATNGSKDVWQTGRSGGTPIFGNRPTGVGLPRIGPSATTGAGDYAGPIRDYHDSGAYQRDLVTVDGQARAFLTQRLGQLAAQRRRCLRNKPASQCKQRKPALVLDIDETSLSNYAQLALNDFGNAPAAIAVSAVSASAPSIASTLELYRQARAAGISVFAITGRPAAIETQTRQNLNNAGYTDLSGIFFKPGAEAVIPFKSGQRAALESQGYRIVANVGDQESDLAGGHADRSFKLPNPFYFIS